jgi:hypothetical protein
MLPFDVAGMNLCSQHLLDKPVLEGRFGGKDIQVMDLNVMVMAESLPSPTCIAVQARLLVVIVIAE